MPALCRFLYNATLAKKILVSSKAKFRKIGKNNRTSFKQKDTDARWVKKNGRSHYGYKNHVNADRKHKFIRTFVVTDASVHDSRVFDSLLDSSNTGKQVFADSAYRSKEINDTLKERGLKNEIHHKGYRGMPLTEAKQRVNHKRSKVRATVEHIFGFQQNSLGGKFIRTIGYLKSTHKDRPDEFGLQHETLRLPDKEQTCTRHRVNSRNRSETCVPNRKTGTLIVQHPRNYYATPVSARVKTEKGSNHLSHHHF